MVDLKASAGKAVEFFNSVYPEPHNSVLVEEVDLSDDGKYWLITLGYNVRVSPEVQTAFDLGQMLETRMRREYKTFKIDRKTGQVISMKIRKV